MLTHTLPDPELAHLGSALRTIPSALEGSDGVLIALGRTGSRLFSDLKADSEVDKKHLSQIVDDLESRGLVHTVRDAMGTVEKVFLGPHPASQDPVTWGLDEIAARERASFLKTLSILLPGILLAQVASVLFARWLGQAEFGFFSLVAGTAGALAYFPHLGMAISLERFQTQFQQANDYSRVRGLLLFTSGITVVVGIVFSIAALLIAILTNQQGSDFRAVALAGVFACVLGLSQVWSSSLVSFARPAWAAFPGALFSPALAIAIAGVVTWVTGSLGAGALIMILIGTSIIALFGQWVGMLRAFPKGFRSTISPVTTEWRTWIKAGPPVLIMSAMVILLYRLDLFALAVFGNTTEVATYAAAITIAEIIGILATAGYSGAVPFFAPFFRSGRTDLVQYTVRQYFRLLLVPAIVLTTIIVVFAGPLLGIYGAGSGSYAAGLAPIMILLTGQLISLLLGPAGYLLIMHGRAIEVAIIYSSGLVVDIILLVVLVPRFGLIGAATCTLVSMFLAQVTMWWLVRRRLGVDSGFWMFRSKPPVNGSSPDVTS